MLETVNGITQKRILCFPEERWSWEKYDLFVCDLIAFFIEDCFLTKDLLEKGLDHITAFKKHKKILGSLKESLHKGKLLTEFLSKEDLPLPLRFYISFSKYVLRLPREKVVAIISVLCQKRGQGITPEPERTLALKKFIDTVQVKPEPLNSAQIGIIDAALFKLEQIIPKEAFSGLATKAVISLSTSATFEVPRSRGGGKEDALHLLKDAVLEKPTWLWDLETGQRIKTVTLNDVSYGEYLFHSSIGEIMTSDPEKMSSLRLVAVGEPSKFRVVTAGHIACKIVLDVVNKICHWPLTRVNSSKSGMAKSNHAWEMFKSFFSDKDIRDIVFKTERKTIQRANGSKLVKEEYQEVFALSTDYETATDNLRHDVARKIGNWWMIKCGIPPLLRGIVNRMCYQPMLVYASLPDILTEGLPEAKMEEDEKGKEGKTLHTFRMEKGVPMGHPLTKVVLHLVNILVRISGENLTSAGFLSHGFYLSEEISPEVEKVVNAIKKAYRTY
jgi:hypothetical protein